MRQALHIFRKDVRRLWPQILAVMLAIAYFAALDIRWSALGVGTAATASEYIVGAAIWLLIARTVHQESLLDENQFWLTHPYERASLLGSKIMMAVVAVSLPLFVADCLILSVQSLSVADNLGGLVLKQLLTAAWLILPPFAVASITRNLAEDAMVWLVGIAMALFAYFPRTDNEIGVAAHWFGGMTADRVRAANNYLRIADEQYAMSIAVVLLLAAIWHQYSRRGTKTSRFRRPEEARPGQF